VLAALTMPGSGRLMLIVRLCQLLKDSAGEGFLGSSSLQHERSDLSAEGFSV
jgi:hypothetical protein